MYENENDDELEIDDTEESDEVDNISYEISYYPADITLKGYLDKYDAGQLVMPKFQRQYVWDQVRASKLIESFLLGLPVPGVFLYKERNTNLLKVIDGQQRILTAVWFFKGMFGESKFRLKKVKEKWLDLTFDQLSDGDQYQLQDSVLRATIVQQLSPEDDSSIYHIFERLNTGGLNLTPMEIRKCVHSGPLMDLLIELNENENWRKLVGRPKVDKRMRDVEWILRILAFYEHELEYEKPMKSFLTSYLDEGRALTARELEARIQDTRQMFESTCLYILQELGEKPFQIKNRFNYAVMDSVFCACTTAYANGETGLRSRFNSLKQDKRFIETSTSSTSDQAVVQERFELARRYLLNK